MADDIERKQIKIKKTILAEETEWDKTQIGKEDMKSTIS